uniref:Uncharacterized protein n=1 Tax=Panagrolaimus superbus TaxID=310955 RepID=A0A914YSG5_9BILA
MSSVFGIGKFLPPYMKMEDIKLIDKGRLELNETFAGQNASFWWKSKNDAMLPSGIFFDSFNNVQINILNSSKFLPYFLRIGSFQPLPSMKFKFDESCNGAEFELYINLRDTPDCQIRIRQVNGGFKFSTKFSSSEEFIKDSSLSPTLIIGKNEVYVKIASLLTIKSYQICNVSTPDVPGDQFVIQVSPIQKIASCKKAEVTILKEDVANGIEILIDRLKIPVPTPTGILNSTVVSANALTESAKAALEWWWFAAGGILLLLIICVALPILIICIYRRKKKQKTKRKIREVSKSIISDEIPIQPKKSKDQTKAKTEDLPAKKKSKLKDLQMEKKESKEEEKKKANNQKKQKTKEDVSKNQESVEQPVAPRKQTKICDSFRERYGYQKESVVDEEENVGGADDKEDPENPLPWYIRNMGVVYQPDPVTDNKTTIQTTQNGTTFSTVSTQNISEKTQQSTTGSSVDKAALTAPKPKRKTSTQSNDRSSKITLEMK